MSSNNNLTRDAYYNYGSYLRSRGYDQYLQRLVEALEAGEIPIGGVSPGQPGLGATVTGNLNVNPNAAYLPPSAPLAGGEGRLSVTGGWAGQGSTTGALPTDLGLQVGKGANILGPIVQQAGLSVTQGTALGGGVGINEFNAATHIFGSHGTYATDSSTVVRIKGDLIIDGSSSFAQNEYVESLTIEGNPGLTQPLLRIFDATGGSYEDVIDVFMDNSAAVANNRSANGVNGFKKDLAFAVDGLPGAGDPSNGSTDVQGHMRSLRGATILSAPSDPSFVIDYKRTPFDLSGIAIDTYGGISVNPGPKYDGATLAPPTIDVSGLNGGLNFYVGGTKYASIDTSGVADFSAMTLSTLDLSSLNVSGGLLHATRTWSAPDGYALKVDGRSIYSDAAKFDAPIVLDSGSKIESLVSQLDVDASCVIAGDLSANGTFWAGGDASLNSRLFVGGDISCNGQIDAGGAVFGADVSLNEDLHIVGDIFVGGSSRHGVALSVGPVGAGYGSPVLNVSGGVYLGGLSSTAFDISSGTAAGLWVNELPSVGVTGTDVKWVPGPVGAGAGYLAKLASSRKYKSNIQALEADYADKLYSLEPKAFIGPEGAPSIGFIAEDVLDLGLDELVVKNAEGEAESLHYGQITAPLLNLVQRQNARIAKLESDVSYLLGKIGR